MESVIGNKNIDSSSQLLYWHLCLFEIRKAIELLHLQQQSIAIVYPQYYFTVTDQRGIPDITA